MKRIIKPVSITTAIILCILTVITAMGTYVHTGGDVRTARFFAMPFSYSIEAVPAPSLANPKRNVIISWIRKNDVSFEEDKVYKLTKISSGTSFDIKTVQDAVCFKEDLYNLKKNVSYYRRN